MKLRAKQNIGHYFQLLLQHVTLAREAAVVACIYIMEVRIISNLKGCYCFAGHLAVILT